MSLSSVVVLGTILAFLGYMIYTIKQVAKGENEKAALENSKAASDAKIEAMNQEYLRTEAQKRAEEKKDLEAFDDDMERSTTRFYPGVLDPNRDPDDLN